MKINDVELAQKWEGRECVDTDNILSYIYANGKLKTPTWKHGSKNS